ncbi:M1 family peptidase, partial [Streptomyces sp. SID4982]|nr:M1 family peptidase [Streptomyces sp. SID4982]
MTSPRRRTFPLGREAVLATVPLAVAALLGAAAPLGSGTTGAAGVGDPYFPL